MHKTALYIHFVAAAAALFISHPSPPAHMCVCVWLVPLLPLPRLCLHRNFLSVILTDMSENVEWRLLLLLGGRKTSGEQRKEFAKKNNVVHLMFVLSSRVVDDHRNNSLSGVWRWLDCCCRLHTFAPAFQFHLNTYTHTSCMWMEMARLIKSSTAVAIEMKEFIERV
jgi:hypothetical protein